MPENLREHPKALQLFLNEAQAAARLNHVNIVTVYDTDQLDGTFFITMELLEGLPLNVILNKRKRQAAVDLDDVPERDIKTGPVPESPFQSASRQELLGRLESALERLPEEQRTVFLLRVQDGLSYEEIAETMGTPKGTVMSRLARARMALRKYMGMPVSC